MIHYLSSEGVQVGPPVGEETLQVVPVLLRERPVHRGGDGDDLVRLVDLGAHQFRLQKVDEEVLHVGVVDLHKRRRSQFTFPFQQAF